MYEKYNFSRAADHEDAGVVCGYIDDPGVALIIAVDKDSKTAWKTIDAEDIIVTHIDHSHGYNYVSMYDIID